jgi:hypothetical protein
VEGETTSSKNIYVLINGESPWWIREENVMVFFALSCIHTLCEALCCSRTVNGSTEDLQ